MNSKKWKVHSLFVWLVSCALGVDRTENYRSHTLQSMGIKLDTCKDENATHVTNLVLDLQNLSWFIGFGFQICCSGADEISSINGPKESHP